MPDIDTSRAWGFVGYFWSAVLALLRLPLALARFTVDQLRGTLGNVRGFLGWLNFERTLPPAIASTLDWLGEKIPLAAGSDNPYRQVVASAALIVAAIATSVFTGGVTIAVVILLLPALFIGLWRFVPWVNDVWKAGRSRVRERDGVSAPRWERD